MDFKEALEVIFANEGINSNDPADHGGKTRFGITQARYNDWTKSTKDVFLITKEEATEIYHAWYWLEGKCDKLPEHLRLTHFDMCVNAGTGAAAKILQRAVKATDDGIIGPATLKAADEMDTKTGLRRYTTSRLNYYHSLTDDPTQRKFWLSWLSRSIDALVRSL